MKKIWTMIRDTFKDWSEDKAPRLAAALSYYTIFSLAPLLVLIIAITGFIVGNNTAIRDQVITQVQSLVGQQGAQAISGMIASTSQPRNGILATVIGIVTLLLGATGVFGQLQDSLNTIWEVKPKEGRGLFGMVKARFLSFSMILGISFLLLVSLVISAALSVLNKYFSGIIGGGLLALVINYVVSIGVITLIFALIFKVLPDVEIAWGDVWIGALITALLFLVGQWAISMYLANAASTSAYGAAGSLVILLLWIYYSAQILFFGAEFTQVYARSTGSQIVPSASARPLTEDELTKESKGLHPRKDPLMNAQQAMMPVTGQPEIYARPQREVVRYEPRNPNAVIPVIAGGVVAGVVAITKIIRQITS